MGGGNLLAALNNTKVLLAVARQSGIPVAHSRIVFALDAGETSVWCVKAKSLQHLTETAPASQIMQQVAPASGECVVRKTKPSAFFATPLA